jgi:type VII secretion effector (TIGR04197 family)
MTAENDRSSGSSFRASSAAHTSNDVLAERIAHLQDVITKQAEKIESLEKEIEAVEKAMTERDRKNLVWGITVLGGVVSTLVGVIWNYRSAIFR